MTSMTSKYVDVSLVTNDGNCFYDGVPSLRCAAFGIFYTPPYGCRISNPAGRHHILLAVNICAFLPLRLCDFARNNNLSQRRKDAKFVRVRYIYPR